MILGYTLATILFLLATGILSMTIQSFLPKRQPEREPEIVIVVDKALVINRH